MKNCHHTFVLSFSCVLDWIVGTVSCDDKDAVCQNVLDIVLINIELVQPDTFFKAVKNSSRVYYYLQCWLICLFLRLMCQ